MRPDSMPQSEPVPGIVPRLVRAVALAIVALGASVGLALWQARAVVDAQGYAALGFTRSVHMEYLAAAWDGWARGLRIAPSVGLASLMLLLLLRVVPRLRPTPDNLLAAVAGRGRAFLVFLAGAGVLAELGLHLYERYLVRQSAWLGTGDVVVASAAFVLACLGIALAASRARDGADGPAISGLLMGVAVLAFGGYWLNRGLWAPPRETDVALNNFLLIGAALLATVIERRRAQRGGPYPLWRTLVLACLVAASLPVVLRSRIETKGAPTIAARNPWNVLVIGVDTARADHTSLVPGPGAERDTTPVLRKLAARGVDFRNAISQAPWTLPSFASIFTGKYPHEHGAFSLDSSLRASELTLAEVLREAGYETFGVVSHLFLEPYRGMAQGYERYDSSQALGHEAITSIQVTERAIRCLEQRDPQRPFFLFAHYFDPHWVYQDHPGWPYTRGYDGWLRDQLDIDGLYKNRHLFDEADIAFLSGLYDEELSYTDKHIGRLLQHLVSAGLAGNTLIVLVGDHGEEFMEHGGLDHTTTVYQELVHVPLAVVPPGGTAAGMLVDGTVETRRLFGTVLELLDVDSPLFERDRQQSLLVSGPNGWTAHPAPAFTSVWLPDSAPRWGKRFKIAALVDGSWKLMTDLTRGKEMLFDLEHDPGELHNVTGRNPERTPEMRGRLHAWIEAMQKAAVGLETAEIPAGQLETLRALGYMDDAEEEPEQ